jgi:sec-independent protein translocase protein TatB
MSGVGFSELLILFLIGLVVLGPERLPRVANQLGTWIGQARRMTRVMKRQLEDELRLEEKPNTIKPATVSKPEYVTPANDADDTFSPDHGPDEPGSGVSRADASEPVTDDKVGNDSKNLQEDIASALPNTDEAGKERHS